MSLTSPDLMKHNNKKTILEIIYKQKNVYRAQIAEMTNMSNQTITNLVKELLADELIKEVTLEKKSKGRNPMALSINAKELLTIGVEISVHGIVGCVYNLDHEVIECIKAELTSDNLLVLKKILNSLTCSIDSSKVLGMALSIEGIVDETSGLVIKSKDIGLNGINILSELAYLELPVLIRNDVNMLAETDPKKHNDENYMLLKLDRGIGAALVLDGQILHSENNAAGEFGHMTVYGQDQPLPCTCGKVGCLTTVTSATALEEHFEMTLMDIKEAMMKDNTISEYLDLSVEYISRPLSNLITFLDLNSVLLTGSIVETFGKALEINLMSKLENKLTSWVSFNGFELIGDYEMTERCSTCVIEQYFLNWKKK